MDVGPVDYTSDEIPSDENKEVKFGIGVSESCDVLDHGDTEDEDLYYPMKRRGLFVLFNHEKFDLNLPIRKGTHVDQARMYALWKKLGFDVKVHNDLTKKEIDRLIDQYSADNAHEKYDCFACAFLTHGEMDDCIFAKDKKYRLHHVIDKFKHCESLVGKPKLFFIQACRGTKLDDGKIQRVYSDAVDAGTFEEVEEVKIPVESDVLCFYSTVEEYYSWRNEKTGSWFVQNLVSCMEKYWNRLDLLQILTLVNREVGRCKSATDLAKISGKKQSPSIVSRLTQLLRFDRIETSTETISETMNDIPDSKPLLQSSASTVSVFGPSQVQEKEKYYQLKLKMIKMKQETMEIERQLCEMKLQAIA